MRPYLRLQNAPEKNEGMAEAGDARLVLFSLPSSGVPPYLPLMRKISRRYLHSRHCQCFREILRCRAGRRHRDYKFILLATASDLILALAKVIASLVAYA